MTIFRKIRIKQSEAPVVPGSRKVGTPDPNEQIEVVLHIRYHPDDKGLPSMEELAAHLPHKRKHLTHKEFQETPGVFPSDVDLVRKFADEYNLVVKEEDLEPMHRLVILSGTIKAFSLAFDVQFFNHQHPEYNKIFRTYEGKIKIPKYLKNIVEGVFGLENIPVFKPFIQHNPQDQGETPCDPEQKGFYSNQMAEFYNFPKGLTGKGQSIALLQFGGGYNPQYLQEYFDTLRKKFNIHIDMKNITYESVLGSENKPYTGPIKTDDDRNNYAGTAETYGDIEVVAAVANEAKVVVYFAPNTYLGLFHALNQAIHDKKHDNSIISISWGWPEPLKKKRGCCSFILTILENLLKKKQEHHYAKSVNRTLHEAAAKEITVCIASGDTGANSPPEKKDGLAHVSFPASSPWALACGGTWLQLTEDNKIRAETVWKHYIEYIKLGRIEAKNIISSSGGGVSDIYHCPPYQVAAGICPKSVNPGHKTGRGMPDIAANADRRSGNIIQFNNTTIICSGTSAVAPLYAALIALINQKLKARVGFLNPFLYQIGNSDKRNNVFNDVTEGDNATVISKTVQKDGHKISCTKGYCAQEGWDACTGWGSINGEALLKALQNSHIE